MKERVEKKSEKTRAQMERKVAEASEGELVKLIKHSNTHISSKALNRLMKCKPEVAAALLQGVGDEGAVKEIVAKYLELEKFFSAYFDWEGALEKWKGEAGEAKENQKEFKKPEPIIPGWVGRSLRYSGQVYTTGCSLGAVV